MRLNLLVFIKSGIYIPGPEVKFAQIELIGGGGAGEGITADGANYYTGRGGGAGAYLRFLLAAHQIGPNRQVTVGQGGPLGTTAQQRTTLFGQGPSASWVGGGSDGNVNGGFGGFQAFCEGQQIGWSAPITKIAGAAAPTFMPPPNGFFFHEGESGYGGLCFINQATPIAGSDQNATPGQTVTRIGRGGMGFYGGTPINNTIVPLPPGFDGAIGCGGSGAVASPSVPSGTVIPGGIGGDGCAVILEFAEASGP